MQFINPQCKAHCGILNFVIKFTVSSTEGSTYATVLELPKLIRELDELEN